jgi:hypothetical protein
MVLLRSLVEGGAWGCGGNCPETLGTQCRDSRHLSDRFSGVGGAARVRTARPPGPMEWSVAEAGVEIGVFVELFVIIEAKVLVGGFLASEFVGGVLLPVVLAARDHLVA